MLFVAQFQIQGRLWGFQRYDWALSSWRVQWLYYYPLKHPSFVQREYEGVWTNSNESRCFWTAASNGQWNDDLSDAPSFLRKILEAASAMPVPYMHHGGRKAIKSRDVVNVNMAKEIKKTPRSNCVNQFRFAFLHYVCLFVCLFVFDFYFSPPKNTMPNIF